MIAKEKGWRLKKRQKRDKCEYLIDFIKDFFSIWFEIYKTNFI